MFVGATAFSFVVGNMAALISKLSGQAGAIREKMDTANIDVLIEPNTKLTNKIKKLVWKIFD